jgi:hypothetical protein
MLITMIFIFYVLFYFVYYYLAQRNQFVITILGIKPLSLPALLIFSVPFYFMITVGTYLGFVELHGNNFCVSPDSKCALCLIIAVVIGISLSYAVLYQVAYRDGCRDCDKAWRDWKVNKYIDALKNKEKLKSETRNNIIKWI